MTHQPWETHRTECGRGRATYHPEWDTHKPWAIYVDGVAGAHFAELPAAVVYFRTRHGMTLTTQRTQDETAISV